MASGPLVQEHVRARASTRVLQCTRPKLCMGRAYPTHFDETYTLHGPMHVKVIRYPVLVFLSNEKFTSWNGLITPPPIDKRQQALECRVDIYRGRDVVSQRSSFTFDWVCAVVHRMNSIF